MKKLSALLIVLVLALGAIGFAACGETNETQLATTRQETFSGRTATESKMEGTHER